MDAGAAAMPGPVEPSRATRRSSRRAAVVGLSAAAIIALAGCFLGQSTPPSTADPAGSSNAPRPSIAFPASTASPSPSSTPTTPPTTQPPASLPAAELAARVAANCDPDKWPGTWAQTIVVVDTSATDSTTAAEIRSGLVDFAYELPRDHVLTIISAVVTPRTVVDHVLLFEDADFERAIGDIEAMDFGGTRNLANGVAAGARAATVCGPGEYGIALIATGVDDQFPDAIRNALHPKDGSASNATVELYGVAVGSGDQEWVLSQASRHYQWAADAGDLPRALLPYRVDRSGETLLSYAAGAALSQSLSIRNVQDGDMTFNLFSPQDSVAIEVVTPSGRTFDGAALDGTEIKRSEEPFGAWIWHHGDRTTIQAFGFKPGEWTVRLSGSADRVARSWLDAEASQSSIYTTRTAYGTGDTTNDLRMGFDLLDAKAAVRVASASIGDPAGALQAVPLHPMTVDARGDSELNVTGPLTLGAIVNHPARAGSYRIVLSVEYTGQDGRRWSGAWMEGAYVLPVRDSDGDGITDALELHWGLNPFDPADGGLDPDHDGLTTARELVRYHTDPFAWDTDGGGESDGSEVAGGRNPLNKADDQRSSTCLDRLRGTSQPTPPANATPSPLPAASLEAILPKEVLGYTMTTFSARMAVTAPAYLSILGLFEVFPPCLGVRAGEERIAVSAATGLESWSVVAVQVDGVTGRQMEDVWYDLETPPPGWTEQTVDGRAYRQTELGWATYVTKGTFFWIGSLAFGDGREAPPSPIPAPEKIVEALVRQLPAR